MRAWIKRGWMACLLVTCLAMVAGAATTGKITGVVTDETTGEPIPGAAVTIEGTVLGALTDDEGRFVILNVPVGSHKVRASIVGYQSMVLTNVGVSVDLTTYEDFELSERAVEMEAVTVTVERPLVIKDQTSSLRIVDEELIQNSPTRGYDEIIQLQSGVTRYADNAARGRARGDRENSVNGTLHIRGGRASEVAYYVDGFSQQDPLTGMSTVNINQNAIQEVQLTTGGFNAEYGKISSGVVNVTTKGGYGTSGYNGGFEVATDNFEVDKSYDYNLYAAHLSGPLLPNNERLSFFASGERRWQGDRAPRANMENSFTGRDRLPVNSLSGWSYQGKLYYDLTNDIQLKAGVLGSKDDWREFRMDYYFNRNHVPRYEDENNSFYGQVVHNISPKTFYTASVNYFQTKRLRGDGVHFDDLLAYSRPDGQTRFDESTLFWLGDDPATQDSFEVRPVHIGGTDSAYVRMPVEATVIDSSGETVDTVRYANEGHVWDDFLKRNSSYVGLDFDVTSQVHPNHEVKSGLEFQRHDLKFYQHYFPVNAYSGLDGGGFRDANNYGYDKLANESDTLSEGNEARNPLEFAGYIQDKFEWQGLVVNAGVRLDVLDVNTRRLVNEAVPLNGDSTRGNPEALDIDSDMEPAEVQYDVSPRLGIGFPVSDQTIFHFSYGKFFQRPDLKNLYVAWDYMEYKIQ
ncbi:MAG: TonB-dependent receptor plug domain-containing protein, partial [candidate division Zixibacteria bacterium]|nr:TonB-dependent receptor plug domain-containing protein [candidate division Zixibacteria bacterium]